MDGWTDRLMDRQKTKGDHYIAHPEHSSEELNSNTVIILSLLKSMCKLDQGPVVQSAVSLTSSLRVISLTVLADSIYNILIFFDEKM